MKNPSLLIMDNHELHLSIEALDLAKENGVTILTRWFVRVMNAVSYHCSPA